MIKIVRVIGTNDQTANAELEIVDLSSRERLSRSLRWVGLGLVISLLFLGLPVIHFFLVPFGLVVTLIAGMASYRTERLIEGADLVCPNCGAAVHIETRAARFPFSENCEGCSRSLTIQAA